MKPTEPVVVAHGKRHAVTVFGCIGEQLKEPVFQLGDSTNQFEFRRFLEECKSRVKPECAGPGRGRHMPVLMLDNAAAHTAGMSYSAVCQKFQPLYMPPHS